MKRSNEKESGKPQRVDRKSARNERRDPSELIGEALEVAGQALKEEARLKEEKELKREAEQKETEQKREAEALAEYARIVAELPDKEEAGRRLDWLELLLRIRQSEALNIVEAALLLGLSVSRVRRLAFDRVLPHYKMRGRLFFKKSEITQIPAYAQRVPTNEETEAEAVNYALFKDFTKH